MQMHEVEEVVSVGTTQAANDRLADGWTLLTVVGVGDGVKYVFGRSKFSVLRRAVAAAQVIQPVDE